MLRLVILVIQMAHDEEARKRILFIILGPVIFILLVIALIIYLVTNPMSYMSEWMESKEVEAVDRFQQDWGYNQRIGMFSKDYIKAAAGIMKELYWAKKVNVKLSITINWIAGGPNSHMDGIE